MCIFLFGFFPFSYFASLFAAIFTVGLLLYFAHDHTHTHTITLTQTFLGGVSSLHPLIAIFFLLFCSFFLLLRYYLSASPVHTLSVLIYSLSL